MSGLEWEILLTAIAVSTACALPGTFLVLRRMSMLTDAISHTVLLGIVLAFFVVEQYGHPLLVVGASVMGVITVFLIELLNRTGLIKEDAAIGITFPALFSLGVLLISLFARNAHLDEHTVFQGDLVYSVFERLELFGRTLGPLTLWKMLAILGLNALLMVLFYKELQLSTFDPALAMALGFNPVLIHYGLITMTSVTAVGAFDSVGSILVIGFMIVPPVTAYLLVDSLKLMIGLSVVIGILGAVLGFLTATQVDASIGGALSLALGIVFVIVLIAAPRKGLMAGFLRRRRHKRDFAVRMLVVHLLQHQTQMVRSEENRLDHLHEHLGWPTEFGQRIVRVALAQGLVTLEEAVWMSLTERGEAYARNTIMA